MIIAIDGPAASGKGTLGKRLAKHYGYRHLDTGVIYRAVAYALLSAGADLTNEMLAVSAALELDPEKFGNPVLKTQKVGEVASSCRRSPRYGRCFAEFSAPVRGRPAWCGARRPRHRHRDLSPCRCEDFRRGRPNGPGPPKDPGGSGERRGRRRGGGARGYPSARRTRPEQGGCSFKTGPGCLLAR